MTTGTRLAGGATLLLMTAAFDANRAHAVLGLSAGIRLSGVVSGVPRLYTVRLEAGKAAWITVFEKQADLAVRVVSDRDAGPPGLQDGFEGATEPITLIAAQPTTYTIEVRCSNTCRLPAPFDIQLDSIHGVDDRDRTRAEAAAASTEARRLAATGSKASRRAAIPVALRAADLWLVLGEAPYAAAQFELVGETFYELGDSGQAENEFRRALSLVRGRSAKDEGSLLNDIAMCRQRLGFADEALQLFRAADQQLEQLPDYTQDKAKVLTNLGMLLCQMGDCNQALEYHRKSIRILTKSDAPKTRALDLNNLATAYQALGDNDTASEYYEQSLPLFTQAKAWENKAVALRNLGVVRIEQGRSAEARDMLQQALRLVGDNSRSGADVLTVLCRATVLSGRPQEAWNGCERAAEIYQSLPDPRGEALARHNLGTALVALHRDGDAAVAFTRAIELRRAIGNPSGLIDSLSRLAMLEIGRSDTRAGLRLAREAVELSDSWRARVTTESLRTSWFATRQASYDAYIEALMRMHQDQPATGYDRQAFEIAERRRARTLLDLLGEARNQIRSNIPRDLAEKESALTRRLNYLTRPGSAQTEGIEDALHEYEAVESKIREANPRYAAILNPPPPKLSDIQAELNDGDALLEYSLGENRSYLWVATRDGLRSFPLAPREALERKARRLANLYSRVQGRRANAAENQAAAASLRRDLLEPAAALIAGRRLLVVPDGALEYVPFAALAPHNSGLASLPSATSVVTHRKDLRNRKPAPGVVAVLADPVFNSRDSRVVPRPGTDRSFAGNLPALPFSRREANAISGMVPAGSRYVATDFAASRDVFLSPRLARYRYIHVATHSVVNTKRPELSAIAFSRFTADGAPVDGNVRLYEIYNLRLPAELVVLSACSTADGKEMRGEGLVGLTQGFLFAGARSVLVTLWPVDDEGTAVFMKEFYSRLLGARPMAPIAALRAAQNAMASQARWGDPYYWAGFELQGDWR